MSCAPLLTGGIIGSKGIFYIRIIFPYSLLSTSKVEQTFFLVTLHFLPVHKETQAIVVETSWRNPCLNP